MPSKESQAIPATQVLSGTALSVVEGQVLRENTVMLDMARALGFKIRSDRSDHDMQIVTLRLEDAAIQRDT